jgi:hypothetical protein
MQEKSDKIFRQISGLERARSSYPQMIWNAWHASVISGLVAHSAQQAPVVLPTRENSGVPDAEVR